MKKFNQAFTLVELSIVLVIIGLLTAGIVGGQSLIDSAKRQKVVGDLSSYKTSIKAFQLEYDSLPGDFKDATSYWGSVASCTAYSAGTGTQTCNGNGDGKINYMQASSHVWEQSRAWQHLSLAGIVPGNYSGVQYTDCAYGTYCEKSGVNTPKSAYDNSAWFLFYCENSWATWCIENQNNIQLGNTSNDRGLHYGPVFKPKEMRAIDLKVDDGMPGAGKMQDMDETYDAECSDGTGVTRTYNLDYTSIDCVLYSVLD